VGASVKAGFPAADPLVMPFLESAEVNSPLSDSDAHGRPTRSAVLAITIGLVLGLALVFADQAVNRDGLAGVPPAVGRTSDPLRIVVTERDVQRVAEALRDSLGRAPTAAELRRGVDDAVRAEVFFRAAWLSGADGDAEAVRSAALARANLLGNAEASRSSRTDAEIEAYLALRPDRYTGVDAAEARALASADLHEQSAEAVRERLYHEAAARFRIVRDRAARRWLEAE